MRRTLSAALRRRLLLESLECRQLLAGDVTATLDGGVLTIIGDDLGNNIVVSAGANPGEVTVSGGRFAGQTGSETTVNGQLAPVTLSGFGGEINLDMQVGDDHVLITNLTMEGSLQAALGDGNDTLNIQSNRPSDDTIVHNDGSRVVFGPVQTGVFVSVTGGEGNDTLALRNLKANGFLSFNGAEGDDAFVQVGTQKVNRLGGTLTLNMESGTDRVSIQRVDIPADLVISDDSGGAATIQIERAEVAGNATISTPTRADKISLGIDDVASAFTANRLAVNSGQGYDQITLKNVATQDLVVNAGLGNNTVSLDHVSAQATLTISASHGTDQLTLAAVVADSLAVRTWGGNDKVSLNSVAAKDAFFDLHDGADDLRIEESIFNQLTALFGLDDDKLTYGELTVVNTATFNGGDGLNTSTDLGGNSIGRLRLINFQTQNSPTTS